MMDNDIRFDVLKDLYFFFNQQVDQQWSMDKTEESVLNKFYKYYRYYRFQMMYYDFLEDVQVIDDKVERIYMLSFKDFRDIMIFYDFQKVLFLEDGSILISI